MTTDMLALVLAIAGGIAGYFGFAAMLGQGYYALVLPGGLLGLAAGIVRTRSRAVPLICAALAVLAGLIGFWVPFRRRIR